MRAWPAGAVELVGALHVHTTCSDGSGTPSEVIAAARRCGLDFVGINDHMSLAVRHSGLGGWTGGTFVLAGAEVHDRGTGGHHMLVYGIDELPDCRRSVDMIPQVNACGGLAIAAHPSESGGYLPMTRPIRWKGTADGLGGVEVWNYMSQWKAGVTLFDLGRRLARPDEFVQGPPAGAVRFWEGTGGCAVAGPDAHAFVLGLGRGRKKAFPYEMLFSRLRTHIVLDRALPRENDPAEAVLIGALREGRCFASNAMLGSASGFRAFRREDSVEVLVPGPCVVRTRHRGVTEERFCNAGPQKIGIGPDGPVTIELLKGGRTWVWCGLAC